MQCPFRSCSLLLVLVLPVPWPARIPEPVPVLPQCPNAAPPAGRAGSSTGPGSGRGVPQPPGGRGPLPALPGGCWAQAAPGAEPRLPHSPGPAPQLPTGPQPVLPVPQLCARSCRCPAQRNPLKSSPPCLPGLATGDTKDLHQLATSEDESLLENIPILSIFLFLPFSSSFFFPQRFLLLLLV